MGVSDAPWAALALASIFVTPFVLCLIAVPWLMRAARRRCGRTPDGGVLTSSDEVFNPEASAPTPSLGAQTSLSWAGPRPRS